MGKFALSYYRIKTNPCHKPVLISITPHAALLKFSALAQLSLPKCQSFCGNIVHARCHYVSKNPTGLISVYKRILMWNAEHFIHHTISPHCVLVTTALDLHTQFLVQFDGWKTKLWSNSCSDFTTKIDTLIVFSWFWNGYGNLRSVHGTSKFNINHRVRRRRCDLHGPKLHSMSHRGEWLPFEIRVVWFMLPARCSDDGIFITPKIQIWNMFTPEMICNHPHKYIGALNMTVTAFLEHL